MKKLLLALLFLTSPVFAQTQTQYYTVPTIAALKAMTTSRPAVVQVVDANPGIFNLSAGACSAADDIFQVQPTGGTTVCYTRAATPYSVGKNATVNANAGTAGGTANALTGTVSTHTSLAAGQTVSVIAASANTSIAPTLTLTLSGGGTVGPFAMTKFGGRALLPHDIFAAGHRLQVIYTGTGFEILNPAISISADSINADNLGIGTSDDTAIWNLIDTQIGLNSQLPKKVWVTKPTNVVRFDITNIRQIDGIKNQPTFNLAATGGISDWLIRYLGTGPFNFENQTLSCPIYDPVTRAQPVGFAALLVQPGTGTQQNSFITVKGVKTVGCGAGIIIYQSMYVVLDDIFNDRTWANGWVVSDALDAVSTHTRHIRISNTYGVNNGQYCGSLPVVQHLASLTLSPVDIVVQNVGCSGSGFIDNKFCFDVTGSAVTSIRFEGWGRNCKSGGMEVKSANTTAVIPNNVRAVDVQFRYDSNYDDGVGVWFAREGGPAPAADLYSQIKGRAFVTYQAPDARQASTFYEAGAVFQANGNSYKVATPGTTASGSGPSGTTTGITDGTAQVDYLQTAPTVSAAMTAGLVEAITDADLEYTFYGPANGIVFYARGSSDTTQRRVNLKLTGWVEKYCFQDSAFVAGTIDYMTLDGSCRTVGGGGYSTLAFGLTYTNFVLKGGPWVNDIGSGTIRVAPSGVVTGKIVGGVNIVGDTGIIYNEGALNLTIGGGGIWNVTNASPRTAIYSTGATATGTITAGETYLTSAASGASVYYDSWAQASSATTVVYGRFIRGYKSTIPTEHCNSGDMFLSQAPGVGGQPSRGWYCSTPGTTWSAMTDLVSGTSGQVLTSSGSSVTAWASVLAPSNGTISAPTYSFPSETTSGWYRKGSGNIGLTVGGKDALTVSGSGTFNNFIAMYSNNTPTIIAVHGSGGSMPITISGAGEHGVDLVVGGSYYVARFQGSGGTSVNYWRFINSIATSTVAIVTDGSDTDVNATFTAKGAGKWISASPIRINASNPLEWGKSTDPGTAPGAAFCKEYWIAGTLAGTGKKVAYCGTSATPTTIVDNVGGGF